MKSAPDKKTGSLNGRDPTGKVLSPDFLAGSLNGREPTGKVLAPDFLARRFKPGQSGNPSGNKGSTYGEVVRTARKYAPEAIQRLVELMRSTDERVAFVATQAILDRAYGKSPEKVAIPTEVVDAARDVKVETFRKFLVHALNEAAQGRLKIDP